MVVYALEVENDDPGAELLLHISCHRGLRVHCQSCQRMLGSFSWPVRLPLLQHTYEKTSTAQLRCCRILA